MLLKVDVRLLPTSCIALIAATAIKAAIRPYSIAVAPSSLFHNLTSVANIQALLWPLTSPPCTPNLAKALKPATPHDAIEDLNAQDARPLVRRRAHRSPRRWETA